MGAMNQYLSNVYHYKTGHLWTITDKITYLENTLKYLKLPFILLVISIFGFILSQKKDTLYILIIVSSIIGAYSLIDNSVFMNRNLIIIGIMITTAISLQNYSEHSLNNTLLYNSVIKISLSILILFYLFANL